MHRDSIESSVVTGLKIGIISADTGTIEQIHGLLQTWDNSLALTVANGSVEQLGPLVEREGPQIVIFDGIRNDDLPALEHVIARWPGIAIILLSPNQSPEFLRQCMRFGVRDILPTPVVRELLTDAIGRIQQRIAAANAPKRKARVFTFLGCKGGSGVSFLAANLAYALAQQDPHLRVALLDLNAQFGDVRLYLCHDRPAATLAEVTRQVHRLDAALLESSMLRITSNLHVLAAPEEPDETLHIRPEHIDSLLWVAGTHYDVILIDIGRSLDRISVRAMDVSERIFPVFQLNVPCVRDAVRLLSALSALGYGKDKLRLIANRVDKRGVITLKDASTTLRHEISHAVPNGFPAVAASIDQGIPIMKLEPRNTVARALRDLASELVPLKTEPSGWIRSLLQRT